MVGLAGLGVELEEGRGLRCVDLGLVPQIVTSRLGAQNAWFFGKTLEARYEDSSSGT